MEKESKNNEVYKIEIEIDNLTKKQYESIWAQLVDISGNSGKEITMKGGAAKSSDENSGLHKHFVKRSTSAFMLIAKTQPKVINANVPIYWKKCVAEQDADLFGGKVVKCNITW